MSLPRGGFRLFEAVTSAIGWPTRVKVAPFSVPDREQIPAPWEKDRVASTSPYWKAESEDVDAWSERCRALLVDDNDITLGRPSMFPPEWNLLLVHNFQVARSLGQSKLSTISGYLIARSLP